MSSSQHLSTTSFQPFIIPSQDLGRVTTSGCLATLALMIQLWTNYIERSNQENVILGNFDIRRKQYTKQILGVQLGLRKLPSTSQSDSFPSIDFTTDFPDSHCSKTRIRSLG